MKYVLYMLACGVLGFSACKKYHAPAPVPLPAATPPIDTTGTMDIVLSTVVNGAPLSIGTTSYTNANADTFTVSTFKYYFTNIVLKTAGGYTWTQPESYYLVDASNPTSLTLHVKGVPRANYSSIQFMLGVDKPRNTGGAQTGALDPANGMFWSWNTGYIMAKFEGYSPQSTATDKKLTYHLGGFTTPYSVLRTFAFTFPNTANITTTHTPSVYIQGELAEWFKTPNTISFASLPSITLSNAAAKSIADNYTDMFTLTAVVN